MPEVVALLPSPAFMVFATNSLLAAFSYTRRRRFPAALAMAALSTGLTDLWAGS
ncbi:MAG: hypothetical protein OXG83_15515 [Acidobacteria bacterium]|nr:hypothetical protein [Acidobacteriota bacterium]